MATLYCKDCGEPLAPFSSILDVTETFIKEATKDHTECGKIKLTTKPGNLYFSLSEVLRSKST